MAALPRYPEKRDAQGRPVVTVGNQIEENWSRQEFASGAGAYSKAALSGIKAYALVRVAQAIRARRR